MNNVESINGGYCEPPSGFEQAVEPKVADEVPWWKGGPKAGLAAFGKEMCEEVWESRGIRPPDGVGCWIVGRMCLAIDGVSQNEAWARMSLIARHLREQEQGEVAEVMPVDSSDSEIDDISEYESVESTPKVFPFKRVSLDRIIPEPVEMVIWPLLPRGELTLIDGDPGVGKTWMWQALVAGLTGSIICPLPLDQRASSSFRALIVTTEDDLAKTIRPRLEALGADLSRIDVFIPTGKEEMFVTAANIDDALASIQRNVPDVVIIDPVTLFVSTERNFDANKATHVRKMFTRLVSEARRLNLALLVSRHFGKTPGKAIHRGIGSIDFSAMARSMLVVGPDPSDSAGKIRVVAHAKSNQVPQLNKGLLFSLDQNGNPPFQWMGLCDINPDHLTDSEAAFHAQDEKSKLDEGKDFYRQILADGRVLIDECREQARKFGISDSALRRARKALGVEAQQEGFGTEKRWYWYLPE
ncbi:MAG: AAA family ATPase [Deltaproteobacteria bacterium]|nr:AAA family ATPase [Deltaproteobacteria bacterium]